MCGLIYSRHKTFGTFRRTPSVRYYAHGEIASGNNNIVTRLATSSQNVKSNHQVVRPPTSRRYFSFCFHPPTGAFSLKKFVFFPPKTPRVPGFFRVTCSVKNLSVTPTILYLTCINRSNVVFQKSFDRYHTMVTDNRRPFRYARIACFDRLVLAKHKKKFIFFFLFIFRLF